MWWQCVWWHGWFFYLKTYSPLFTFFRKTYNILF
jgi:hypothetical protein